jgi:hypothetical protein
MPYQVSAGNGKGGKFIGGCAYEKASYEEPCETTVCDQGIEEPVVQNLARDERSKGFGQNTNNRSIDDRYDTLRRF